MIARLTLLAIVLVTGIPAVTRAAAPTIVAAPRNTGPATVAHTRTRRHRRSTSRVTRRTPEVMQEDAARIRRGDLFSSWSNAANN